MSNILSVAVLAFTAAAGCAQAADLAYVPPAIVPIEAVSWSGCYVGSHSGLAARAHHMEGRAGARND